MGLVIVGVVGRRVADVRTQHQQAGPVGHGLGVAQRPLEGVEVVGDLAQFDHVPAVRPEAFRDVVAVGQRGVAVDRDVVVVVDRDQLAEPEMAGQRGGLVRHALHHASVTGDHVGVVVDRVAAEPLAEDPFGERHPDRVRKPLTERTGRDLDPCGVTRPPDVRAWQIPIGGTPSDPRVRVRAR